MQERFLYKRVKKLSFKKPPRDVLLLFSCFEFKKNAEIVLCVCERPLKLQAWDHACPRRRSGWRRKSIFDCNTFQLQRSTEGKVRKCPGWHPHSPRREPWRLALGRTPMPWSTWTKTLRVWEVSVWAAGSCSVIQRSQPLPNLWASTNSVHGRQKPEVLCGKDLGWVLSNQHCLVIVAWSI